MGCHFLFQGISPPHPPQGSNPHLCVSCFGKCILYHRTPWEAPSKQTHTEWWQVLQLSFSDLPRTYPPQMTVSFTLKWLGHRISRHLVRYYFGCVCESIFGMRLTLELVDWVSKLLCIIQVGLIQSVEDLTWAKGLNMRELGLSDSEAGPQAFFSFQSQTKMSYLSGSQACSF